MASRSDSIVFYNEFTLPEGEENQGQCGQNLGKTLIFVFFLLLAWKMLRGDFGRSKAPNLGPKSGLEAMKFGSEKRGLWRRELEIRFERKMNPKKALSDIEPLPRGVIFWPVGPPKVLNQVEST